MKVSKLDSKERRYFEGKPSPEQLRSELQPTHTCGLAIVLHLGLVGTPVPMQSLFDWHTWPPDVGDRVLPPPLTPLVGLFVSV